MKPNEQYFAVVVFMMLYAQGCSNLWVCEWNPNT